MEARLNKSVGPFSAGTRVEVLTNPKNYEDKNWHGFDRVRLTTPPSHKFLDQPNTSQFKGEFDIEYDALTPCRSMQELVPSRNRHKRRTAKRAEFKLLQELSNAG